MREYLLCLIVLILALAGINLASINNNLILNNKLLEQIEIRIVNVQNRL